jgi:hypothetical protein
MNNKQWEESFDLLFNEVDCDCEYCLEKNRGDIKYFIHTLLKEREAEIRKETIEAVKVSNKNHLKKLCWEDRDIEYFLDQYR